MGHSKRALTSLSSKERIVSSIALTLATIALVVSLYHSLFFSEWKSLSFALAETDSFEMGELVYKATHPFRRRAPNEKNSLIVSWKEREDLFTYVPKKPSLEQINRLNGIVCRIYGEHSYEAAERYLHVAYEYDRVSMFAEEEKWLEKSLNEYEHIGAVHECIWVSSWLCQTLMLEDVQHPRLKQSLERAERFFAMLPPGQNSLNSAEVIAGAYHMLGELDKERRWRSERCRPIRVINTSGQPLRFSGSNTLH